MKCYCTDIYQKHIKNKFWTYFGTINIPSTQILKIAVNLQNYDWIEKVIALTFELIFL